MSQLQNLDKLKIDGLALFRAVAEHAPIGIQIYDRAGYSVYVNGKHTQMFGSLPPPGYCVLKDEVAADAGLLDMVREVFAGKPMKTPMFWYDPRELRHLNPEEKAYVDLHGRRVAIQTTMIPIFGDGGKVENVVFIHADVTAELYMQKERDDAKTLVQDILDQTQAIIYIKNLEGRLSFVNGQFCRVFDKRPDEVLGRTNHELFPAEYADRFSKNDKEALERDVHIESEEQAVHPDGTTHDYVSLKFPIRDSEGRVYGLCGISTDITRSLTLERELSRAKRAEAVALMAGGIAHNFNNVLSIIMLVADTLLMTGPKSRREVRKSVESIREAAQSAALLTRQLLTFRQRQKAQPVVLDLGKLLRARANILGNAVGEDVRFTVRASAGLWTVRADPGEIEQVLTNLCLNARDAMPRGGRLTLTARNRATKPRDAEWRLGRPIGQAVEITVRDSGQGIPAAHLTRLFEPFFTTKGDGRGTGLGLITVHSIVEAYGGDIAVESAEGAGTTFRILLPKADRAPASPDVGDARDADADARPAGGVRRRSGHGAILLVEDQTELRRVTAKLLRRNGYRVIEAPNARVALARWKDARSRIELVISDIVLSGASGLDLVARLEKTHRGLRPLRVLFVSAYSEKKLSDYQYTQGDSQFIEKPYSAQEILRKVRALLERPSPKRT